MSKTINNHADTFRIWNNIVFYLLLIIVILGFTLNINILNKDHKKINEVDLTLKSLLQPSLVFNDYAWIRDTTKKLDCNHPPVGMVVTYQNKSNISIILSHQRELINYNGHSHEYNTPDPAEEILPPYGVTTIRFQLATFIQDEFKNKTNAFEEPSMIFNYSAIISDLNKIKKSQVDLINTVGIDCKTFKEVKHIGTLKAEYHEITGK